MMTSDQTRMDSRDVMEVLAEMTKRGMTTYYFGGVTEPTAIGGTMRRGWHWADVYILRAEDRAVAYRAFLKDGNADPFTPVALVWHYLGNADVTLGALLRLNEVHPAELEAPDKHYGPPHPDLGVPLSERGNHVIRPPARHPGRT